MDEVDDFHSHFEFFKSTIETDFKHLKEATSQNVQNIQTSFNIQINAPEYDPDIDRDNQPNTHNSPVTISVQGTLNTPQESSILEDDNSTAPDNITTSKNQQETDWPEATAIQILGISSTTSDQPPEVTYNRCQIQPSSTDLEISKLEEDSDQDQFADPDNLITHHNIHQESERI